MDQVKKGLPVWVKLHKNQAKIAGTVIDYAFSHEGNYLQCMVELEIPNPLTPDQVLRQIHPQPIQSYKLSKRTPTETNRHTFTETPVSANNETQQHTIYTIGYAVEATEQHAAHSQLEAFLRRPTPGVIIDVRLTPSSKIPGWSLEDLQQKYQARYIHLTELGNLHHHTSKSIKLVDEEAGLDRLEGWLDQFDICLLCGCYRAGTCHRSYIAEKLAERTHAPICHLPQGRNTERRGKQLQEAKAEQHAQRSSLEYSEKRDQHSLWTPELWEPGSY